MQKHIELISEGYEEIKDVNQLASDILYSLSYKLNATKVTNKQDSNKYIYEFTKCVTDIEESVNYSKLKSNTFKNFCDKYKNISITFEKGVFGNARYLIGKKIILFISDEKELEINQDLNNDITKNISVKEIYFKTYNKFHSVLEHELQHLYDDYISNGQVFNVKQSKDDSEYDSNNFNDVKEYINLPYEVNAKFTQAINKTHFLELVDFTDDNKTVEKPYPFKEVLKQFFNNFPHKKMLNDDNKNTIIKRLYNIYNKAIENAKNNEKIELLNESNSNNTILNINCYHASLYDFNYFDSSKIGSMIKLDKIGFFFTKNEEDANDFGILIGKKQHQDFYFLYKCLVKIKNPYTFQQFQKDFNGEYQTSYDGNLTSTFDLNKEFILNKIKENGNDGLIFGNLIMCVNSNQINIINKQKIERVISGMEKYRRQQEFELINESNSQLEDTYITINSPNIKCDIDNIILKYGDEAEIMNHIKYPNEETNKPEYSLSYTYCKYLISTSEKLKDKFGENKKRYELMGGPSIINHIKNQLNMKRDMISRSKNNKKNIGMNNQFREKDNKKVNLAKSSKRIFDNMLREHIELCEDIDDNLKKASVAILLNDENKFLLLKRSDKTNWMPNKYALVGGKVDDGETPEEACLREIYEETKLSVKNNKLFYCLTIKEDGYLVNFYVGYSENPNNIELNGEHTEFKWCEAKDLLSLETPPNLINEIKKTLEIFQDDVNKESLNEDMSSTNGLALYKPKDADVFVLYNPKTIEQGLKDFDSDEIEPSIYGIIELGEKNGTLIVDRVVANKGFGPIMYLVALQFAGKNGLAPTRIKNQVSDSAKNIWKNFFDGKGSEYVKSFDLEDNVHDEDYLNKKYVLNKNYSDYNKMINTSNIFLKNDKHSENANQIWGTADSILTNKMREIY